MTTTGEYLLSKSTLPIGTALAHFLTMQTGGGTGQGTVFAAMFAVQIDEPQLTLVQRAKREAGESVERAMRQIDERSDSDVSVLTGTVRMSVLTAPEWLTVMRRRAASVFVRRDVQSAVVRQCDVLEMN